MFSITWKLISTWLYPDLVFSKPIKIYFLLVMLKLNVSFISAHNIHLTSVHLIKCKVVALDCKHYSKLHYHEQNPNSIQKVETLPFTDFTFLFSLIWWLPRCWMALWRQVIIVRLQRCSLNWPSSQWWTIIVQDEKFNLGPTRSYESIKDCMLTAWYRSYSLLIIIRLPQFDNFLIVLNLIPLLNQFNYHWFHRDYRHCCQHLSQSAFAQERPRVFPRRRNASLLHRWEMD